MKGKLWLIGGLLCLTLLFLSALVEAPATAPDATAPAERAPQMVMLLPAALPAQDGSAVTERPEAARAVALIVLCAAVALPAVIGKRDANGRVLRGRSYVQSVYQVYHQEAASG